MSAEEENESTDATEADVTLVSSFLTNEAFLPSLFPASAPLRSLSCITSLSNTLVSSLLQVCSFIPSLTSFTLHGLSFVSVSPKTMP